MKYWGQKTKINGQMHRTFIFIFTEHFQYLDNKYRKGMVNNPVLVMPTVAMESLDMMPRVNVLEDIQFRKAIPKSFKLFKKMAPFSERLGNIKDYKKFMGAISKDMLRTVVNREKKFYRDQRDDENLVIDTIREFTEH